MKLLRQLGLFLEDIRRAWRGRPPGGGTFPGLDLEPVRAGVDGGAALSCCAGMFIDLLENYITYGILLVLEPILLCTWGYTPGKWIFGLTVRNRDGGKLTWAQARTWGVFARGEGYGIPFYNLLQSLLPIHRGPLTLEEYAANVNDMWRILDIDMGARMSASGHWIEQPNHIAIGFGMGGPAVHWLTVDEDGYVTGVRIEEERLGGELVSGSTTQRSLAALALIASRKDYNGIS